MCGATQIGQGGTRFRVTGCFFITLLGISVVGTTALRGVPLAERMRPRTFDEFVGQEELLGPGRPLRGVFWRGHRLPRRSAPA
jgi:hypothetical protein